MKIEKDTVVTVSYRLHAEVNGGTKEFIEETTAERPFVFLYGYQGVIEDFEKNLKGLTVGQAFDFVVSPENGYGDIDEDAIVDLPYEVFAIDGQVDKSMLTVGSILPMSDNNGRQFEGKILETSEEGVTMDFNHPMAGKTLYFSGSVTDVRPATREELAHGHVHGPGGHHHH